MILTIIFTVLLLKIKGYRVTPALKTWALYPFFTAEILYYFLQLNIFLKNFEYIRFAGTFKSIYIYTMLVPVIVYKLYKPALAGSALVLAGTAMNRFVIYANGGKMPIYPTISRFTGYFDPAALNSDSLHILGNASTKFAFLSDFLDTGFSILSIGDLLIRLFFIIVLYKTVKAVNKHA